MISIETSVCNWAKSSEPPVWSTKMVWLNPDHIVSIEVTKAEFRGSDAINRPDVDEFTEVHTTKTRYITTEPADELAKRIRNYPESKFTYSEAINPKIKGIFAKE